MPPETLTEPLAGKRAVVVEDEGITQILLTRIVRLMGMTVAGTAATGETAVDVVLRERPDLVLMDIKMPGTINGLEASRRILQQYPTCIVVLTAYDHDEFRDEAQELGASGYVTKPVNAQLLQPELRAAYERFLHR